MGAFRVKAAYYMSARDIVVMTGVIESEPVDPGRFIDLPKEIGGPGWVQISNMERVQFTTHMEIAVCFPIRALDKAPLFDVSQVEGHILDVK